MFPSKAFPLEFQSSSVFLTSFSFLLSISPPSLLNHETIHFNSFRTFDERWKFFNVHLPLSPGAYQTLSKELEGSFFLKKFRSLWKKTFVLSKRKLERILEWIQNSTLKFEKIKGDFPNYIANFQIFFSAGFSKGPSPFFYFLGRFYISSSANFWRELQWFIRDWSNFNNMGQVFLNNVRGGCQSFPVLCFSKTGYNLFEKLAGSWHILEKHDQ